MFYGPFVIEIAIDYGPPKTSTAWDSRWAPSRCSSTREEICSKFAPGEMAGPMQLLWRPGEASFFQGPHGFSKLKAWKFQWKFLFCIWNVGIDEFSSGIQRWFLQFPNGSPWKSWSRWIGVSRISHISIATSFMVNLLGMSRRAGNSRTIPCRCGVPNGTRGHVDQRSSCAQVHHIWII